MIVVVLKSVKTCQTYEHPESTVPDFPRPLILNSENRQRFIGYSFVKKGNIFRSHTEKFYPWRKSPSPAQWIREEDARSAHETTIRFRLQFQILTEVTNSFKYYQLRPVKIPYFDRSGGRQIYEPLALLTYWDDDLSPRNRPALLLDVRSDAEIRACAGMLIPAFRAAARFAQKRKLHFRLFRNSFFRSNYFANLTFMRQYCLSKADSDNRALIKDVLESLGVIEFSALIDMLGGKEITESRGRLIHDVWVLVQKGAIKADWDKPFNKDTLLWL